MKVSVALLLAIVVVVGLATTEVSGQCSARTTCNTCTVDTTCGWCMNTVRGTAECLPGNAAGPTTEWCAEWRYLKSQYGNPVGGFPFNPAQLDVYLVNSETLTIPLEFILPPQDTLPLDIFILQDNSASMANDINDLFALVPQLVNGVIEFQFDARFGIAAFVDRKSAGASYSSAHAYKFLQALTNNYNVVAKAISDLAGQTANNYDTPEMGYDAFLAAAVGGPIWNNLPGTTLQNCPKPGWRPEARHLAIMITDATPKSWDLYQTNSGVFSEPTDARPARPGTSNYHENNNDCVPNFILSSGYLNAGSFSSSGEFSPRVASIAALFSPSQLDIYPIFYTEVSDAQGINIQNHVSNHITNNFKRGRWGRLGVTDLSALVISALQEIASTVAPEVTSDPGNFYVASTLTVDSNSCSPGPNLPGCRFTFSLDLRRNPGNTAQGDVVVRVPGFGDTATSVLRVTNTKFFCEGCNPAIPNSVVDHCGICNGNNASCTDCFGVVVDPGQPIAQDDACGVCDGDGSSCWDCLNMVFDTDPAAWRLDACGICRAPADPLWNTTCMDCFFVFGGTAREDACGVCGGNNACVGCDGFPPHPTTGYVARYDACGVCGGDNSTCVGCDGVIYLPGLVVIADACGVCGGDSTSCVGCPGQTVYGVGSPFHDDPPVVDACGVCGGDNSSCFGCDGIANSTWTVDICGDCTDGSGTPACLDCTGLPFGEAAIDACSVCGGSKSDETQCNVAGDDPAVIVGAAVGATVAAVALAVAAFLLYMRWKNPNWYFQDALDNLEATQSHNPLYEAAGTEKSNPLYTGQ